MKLSRKQLQEGYVQALRSVCLALGVREPQPEYRFSRLTDRQWRFDFAWPLNQIALEVEGELFGKGKECPLCGRKAGGAHTSTKNLLKDVEKYNQAAIEGWAVLRVTPKDLSNGNVYTLLEKVRGRLV